MGLRGESRGLMVDLAKRYQITLNGNSRFGRYDVMFEPYKKEDSGIMPEFKVYNLKKEKNLKETVKAEFKQIEDKKYAVILAKKGFGLDKIRRYGFAFEGRQVLTR
ncbi:MAG: hypothetical protein HFH63_03405 [Lachnospiraceae bacterium]|nr:hypothetical protein [Lachnospiraceae bacterium]